MTNPRVDFREPGIGNASGAFGAGPALQPPVVRSPSGALDRGTAPERSWWSRGLRLARNAAIAVGVMTLVPIGLVMTHGDWLALMMYRSNANTFSHTAAVDDARPLRVPVDPSITPMAAGLALNALQPSVRSAPGFEPIVPAARPVAAWHSTAIPEGAFVTSRTDLSQVPSSRTILEASAKGFSPAEMAYLRALATSPVWREFELVARASRVDIVGGQFRIPFGPEASAEARPLPSFRGSKEIAHAAVSRAAYHLALGQRDSAELVLRSVVSYGFALVDNGTSAIEQLIGSVVVGIGRDALQRFYLIEHDPRAGSSALAAPPKQPALVAPTSPADARRRLLTRMDDPTTPLGERFEGVRVLSAASCTNVRELMFGPPPEVSAAIDRARRTIARFPSEQALVDLDARRPLAAGMDRSADPVLALAVSSATVAGVVLHNPRLAICTRMFTGQR